MAPNNRFSPKRPLIAAILFSLGWAVLGVMGYRGKYQPTGLQLNSLEAVELFLKGALIAFPIFYLVRMLGIEIGPWGGPERRD